MDPGARRLVQLGPTAGPLRQAGQQTNDGGYAPIVNPSLRTSHNPLPFTNRSKFSRGLTLMDVIIAVATVALAAALLLPWLARSRARPSGIRCVNCLKQVDLGLHIWYNDHVDKFPWQVPEKEGGTKEYAASSDVFR